MIVPSLYDDLSPISDESCLPSYTNSVRLCEIYFDYAEIAGRSLPSNRAVNAKQNIRIPADLFEATLKGTSRAAWTADEQLQADRGAVRVAGMIAAISRHMDRFFAQGGYTVPLEKEGWPYVELICATLTRCRLYDDNRPEYMQIDCSRAEAELKAIANRETDIPGIDKSSDDIIVRDLYPVIPTTLGDNLGRTYRGWFRKTGY